MEKLASDIRALQKGSGTDRIAAQWGANGGVGATFDLDCNLTDGKTHQVALYALDWNMASRSETVQVLDAANGEVLDTEALNSFVNGIYYVWNVQGHVIFRVINISPVDNPALSGIFFDPPAGFVPPVRKAVVSRRIRQ